MSDDEVRDAEDRLRVAMLASDVGALDALIHPRLRFVGPDGSVASKDDDLALHRSGTTRFSRIDLDEVVIERHGETAISVVRASLAGEFRGTAFAGPFRYVRVWVRADGRWQVAGGSVSMIAGP